MTVIRRTIVITLERACAAADRLWDWPTPAWWVARCLGCPRGLALLSAHLDERWHTEVWEKP